MGRNMRDLAANCLSESDLQILEPGVGTLTRGDLSIFLYATDASLERSRWLFGCIEKNIARCGQSIQGMLIIPAGTKPPDQATREMESEYYARLGPKLRRLVVVPEGNAFRISLVRMVVSAQIFFAQRGSFFFFAKNMEDGIRLVTEAATPMTPSASQIQADTETLRRAVAVAKATT
jgi:hypothetical protein